MRKEKINNEILYDEITALKVQFNNLQQKLDSKNSLSQVEISSKFLIAQFNEFSEFYRHVASRMENTVNLFLTANAIIVSIIVLVFQKYSDFSFLIPFNVFIALGLFLGGIVVSKRILNSALTKIEYLHAINTIREYFTDLDSNLNNYLTIRKKESITIRPFQIQKFLILLLYPWNSILCSYIICLCIQFIFHQVAIQILSIVFSIVFMLCYSIFVINANRYIKKQIKIRIDLTVKT